MDAKMLQDKGLWGLLALAVFGILSLFRSNGERRARKRAEKAAATAENAQQAAIAEKASREKAWAQAQKVAADAKIVNMGDESLFADAKARIEMEETGPRKGLFTPPPKGGKLPKESK